MPLFMSKTDAEHRFEMLKRQLSPNARKNSD